MRRIWRGLVLGALAAWSCAVAPAQAQTLSGADLTIALRRGGYVLVMAHARSPAARPDGLTADAENMAHERQLDEIGRNTAAAMSRAFATLGIKVEDVYSSPTYRALETVKLTDMEPAVIVPALGDGTQGVQPQDWAKAQWLRLKVNEPTVHGANRLIVTQIANIQAAFPEQTSLVDGEILVFQPYARGTAGLVARVRIDAWPDLAG